MTAPLPYRTKLPQIADRLALGRSALEVSPICLGTVSHPEIVVEAFDMGVNFFFLSGDLHWPLYEGLRKGLELLLDRSPSVRGEIVVAVTSYVDQPLFDHLQTHEVVQSVRNLRRVDMVLAGAVHSPGNLAARQPTLARHKALRINGARAAGASFHDRKTAAASIDADVLDAHFIRLNTGHPGARKDILPGLREGRKSLVFSFTSMMGRISAERFAQLGLGDDCALPEPTSCYRYVLTHAGIDGLLCAPRSLRELAELQACLQQPPLAERELSHLEWLSSLAYPRLF